MILIYLLAGLIALGIGMPMVVLLTVFKDSFLQDALKAAQNLLTRRG